MLKAAFYQVEQCQEPPEEIRAEMQEFAADVGLGFHAFYMDSPKPWYLSEPSSVLRKMVEDASERKFDILIIERMSDFTNCCMDAQKVLRAMKSKVSGFFTGTNICLNLMSTPMNRLPNCKPISL